MLFRHVNKYRHEFYYDDKKMDGISVRSRSQSDFFNFISASRFLKKKKLANEIAISLLHSPLLLLRPDSRAAYHSTKSAPTC